MGVVKNIKIDSFPKQGDWLGLRVNVCFHYDLSCTIDGEIVREDAEEPYETIIRLDDGRFVRAQECQYSPNIKL